MFTKPCTTMQKISLQMLRQLVASCLPVVWCQTGKALQVFNTFFDFFTENTFLAAYKSRKSHEGSWTETWATKNETCNTWIYCAEMWGIKSALKNNNNNKKNSQPYKDCEIKKEGVIFCYTMSSFRVIKQELKACCIAVVGFSGVWVVKITFLSSMLNVKNCGKLHDNRVVLKKKKTCTFYF